MSSENGIFTEAMLEEAAIEILQSLDYDYAFGPDISLGGDYEERKEWKTHSLGSTEIFQGRRLMTLIVN